MVSWAVMIVAIPMMLVGFFRYNDMTFEQFAKEWLHQNFTNQRREYEYQPIFVELRSQYLAQDLESEIKERKLENKSNRRKKHKGA
jgi:hypothetical protein